MLCDMGDTHDDYNDIEFDYYDDNNDDYGIYCYSFVDIDYYRYHSASMWKYFRIIYLVLTF